MVLEPFARIQLPRGLQRLVAVPIPVRPDAVEVLDVSFPPRVTNVLEWRIQSEFAGEVQVEIRYFTSGISWSADYVAEANKAEKLMTLAKALEPAGTGHAAGAETQSPTITTPAMTQAGVILGTAAYMSPEQARGKVVDRRADIWAFGCVLYEMLSGKQAFAGSSAASVIASGSTANPRVSKSIARQVYVPTTKIASSSRRSSRCAANGSMPA